MFTKTIWFGRQAGAIEYARDWTMKNVRFVTADGAPVAVTNSENVAAPEVAQEEPAPVAKPQPNPSP